ncbi:MAG: isoaspartyl peptidase/L-asparaginase [Planctomycetota bacterium]|nr:isoaspartyl peptidase/L-asparaginase [Planctomycetota bacterium]
MDKPPPPRAALIVHAGAWAIPDDEREAHRAGCTAAIEAGWEVLKTGGRALDAIVTAIRIMEDDFSLNAGRGSVLNLDGRVELDAGIMDGSDLSAGGVAAVTRYKHPIDGAERVRTSRHVLLVGSGADRYLETHGIHPCEPEDLITEREVERLKELLAKGPQKGPGTDFGMDLPGDTVGAVAIDQTGNIAAGASTGGVAGKMPGRMGDTAIPGSGYFADNLAGGVSCTGWGEPILRMGLARRVADLLRDNNATDAAWIAIQELESRFKGKGGVIVIGRDGSIGFSYNTPAMALAYMDEEMEMPFIGGGI